jgi:hypothetical protein
LKVFNPFSFLFGKIISAQKLLCRNPSGLPSPPSQRYVIVDTQKIYREKQKFLYVQMAL